MVDGTLAGEVGLWTLMEIDKTESGSRGEWGLR